MFDNLQGWIQDNYSVNKAMETLPFPLYQDVQAPLKGSGKGKVVLLYDVVRKVVGDWIYRVQTIGDCASMGTAYAVDIAKCVDILIHGDAEQFVAETATEHIYWLGRVVVGKSYWSSDGCSGVWCGQGITQYGALPRGKYGNIDLSKYSGENARRWASQRNMTLQPTLEYSKQHLIQTMSQVRTYEEVRDLVANYYPVTIASNCGFKNPRGGASVRDKDGVLAPYGTWNHLMHICGVDDNPNDPMVCIGNSWPLTWVKGPKRHNQPDGTFWCRAEVLEKRILSARDSWAFSGYQGFEQQKVNLLTI